MFFLRCAFWLSVVYSTMTWSHTSFASRDLGPQALDAGRTVAMTVVNRAVASATERCAQRPEDCLGDAARLTSLFTASEGTRNVAVAPATKSVETDVVPLPVPDPRRLARAAKAAKLARAP